MRSPYIGITDFMTQEQTRAMLGVLREAQASSAPRRRLGVGVMMSKKTLYGLPTKWTNAFPHNREIETVFVPDPNAYNVLHYADYDIADQRQANIVASRIHADLLLAASWGGKYMHAMQLDMIWPNPAVVKAFRERHPEIEVIIQGNTKALEAVSNDPVAFVAKLAEYGDVIDFVLLDKSGGKGIGMDAQVLLPYARAVADRLPNLSLAAAGGLGPLTIDLVFDLVREFPDISIDAQSKLRPSGDALDPIDWGYARAYIERSVALFVGMDASAP